jgi:hypothetical protein
VTTRKQKREEMVARREKFEQDMRQSGLKAQARDREHRQRKAARAKEDEEREARGKKAIEGTSKVRSADG